MQHINSHRQLGEVLASRRKALQLSQSELAGKLGISQNRLSELEDDAARLTVERLLAMLNLLGLELAVRERPAGNEPSRVEW